MKCPYCASKLTPKNAIQDTWCKYYPNGDLEKIVLEIYCLNCDKIWEKEIKNPE